MQKSAPSQEATLILRGVLVLALGVFIGVFLTLWTVKATLIDVSRQQVAANNTEPANISTPKISSIALPTVSFSLNPNSPRGSTTPSLDQQVLRFDVKVITDPETPVVLQQIQFVKGGSLPDEFISNLTVYDANNPNRPLGTAQKLIDGRFVLNVTKILAGGIHPFIVRANTLGAQPNQTLYIAIPNGGVQMQPVEYRGDKLIDVQGLPVIGNKLLY